MTRASSSYVGDVDAYIDLTAEERVAAAQRASTPGYPAPGTRGGTRTR
jgi:hypothetical protein